MRGVLESARPASAWGAMLPSMGGPMHTVLLPAGRRTDTRRTRAQTHDGTRIWAAYIMSGIAAVFMLFDGVTKLLSLPQVVDGMTHLGYPGRLTPLIGVLLLVCLTCYVVPATA